MRVTGVAQRRSWAGEGLPPTEEVRPGLWSIPVPIPNNPLRYVLSYGFETGGGVVLVDPGWHAEAAYEALVAGLQQAGFSVQDVRGVLVTHVHPDHYGLAPRLRDETGAWVALHAADAELIHHGRQPIHQVTCASTTRTASCCFRVITSCQPSRRTWAFTGAPVPIRSATSWPHFRSSSSAASRGRCCPRTSGALSGWWIAPRVSSSTTSS